MKAVTFPNEELTVDEDGGGAIRSIVARSFALQAASLHAQDPESIVELAGKFADWVLGGEPSLGPSEAVRKTAEGCLTRAKLNLKAKKGGGR